MQKVTLEHLTKWRRHLHENPELSLKEYETKKYIKNILDENNIDYEEILDTGLVVKFNSTANNEDKKTILFRADIDALPIEEENNINFKSKTKGVMHACGHDGHTAILLGTILEINEYYKNNETKINSIFIFQPAEETIGGASLIIQNYDFKKHNIIGSYALHLNPDYEENTIISKENEIMASATEVRFNISGQSAHVGLKHKGIDALNVGTMLYQELLKLNILNLNAKDTNIIHIGKMWGGDALNIVAQSSHLEGTIRTYSEENFKIISEKIILIATGLEILSGCKIEVDFGEGYPAVHNDKKLYEIIKEVVKRENIDYIELEEAYLYGEDFSAFYKVSPINYSFLGIRNEKLGYISGLHTPTFNFDENILLTGVKYFIGIFKYYNNN